MLLWYFFVYDDYDYYEIFSAHIEKCNICFMPGNFFTNFPRSLPRNNNKRYKKYGKGGMFNHMFKLHLSNKCSFVHLQPSK